MEVWTRVNTPGRPREVGTGISLSLSLLQTSCQRWGHTSSKANGEMIVYGGFSKTFLDDIHVYNCGGFQLHVEVHGLC